MPRRKFIPREQTILRLAVRWSPILICFFILQTPHSSWGRIYEQYGGKNSSLKILTSFSPAFYGPFIESFQRLYPNIQVQILNKKTTAALAEIVRGNPRGFDIFWTSSPDALTVLKDAKLLMADSGYSPGYSPLCASCPSGATDSGGFYRFALSGVGFMWNNPLLKRHGVSPPNSWQDLLDKRYYGMLAMSTPARSGTNHLIVESLLQGLGWDEGWSYLLQLVGNMETLTARSFSVPDGVASGRFGIGLVIDFLAMSKMQNNSDVGFAYGKPVFVLPAGIALLKDLKNQTEANQFLDFVLSLHGQSILLSPGINRVPVSADVFTRQTESDLPPLVEFIQAGMTRSYDTELSKNRYALVNALFDQLITYHFLERRKIWKTMNAVTRDLAPEKAAELHQQLVTILCRIPVSEDESVHGQLNEVFSLAPLGLEEGARRRQIIREWERFVQNSLDQADLLLAPLTTREVATSVD